MVKSFRHKGLEKFFLYDDRSTIVPGHAPRLTRILDRLDASAGPDDMNLPGFKLHRLAGKDKGAWSVWVNGNWRVTFQFEGADAVVVDYRDYH